ncbi:MAG TPA: cation diffusion facilitator family transporter [Steroidobacteraceae bacterium]|jgi:cobalt-zinc-cadmium efflux system protein
MQGRLAVAIALNLIFVGVEVVYGFIANSVALIADAGHNLSDVLGLVATLVAAVLATRPARGRFTYGMRRATVLAALGNAVLLLFTSGAIAWEAVQRLLEPQPVGGLIVMIVAGLGMVASGASAWLLGAAGHAHDLNIRSAFLHMVGDAVVSAGVVLSGLIILRTGWTWVDPLVSLIVVSVILAATWGLLRDALHLSMDAVPRRIDLQEVHAYLSTCSGVAEVHDLHVWGMSTSEAALTVHLVAPNVSPNDDQFRNSIVDELRSRFGIRHTTLQVEYDSCQRACGS